jgi:ferredoxin-like protein FixX
MTKKNMWGDINDMTDLRTPHEIIEEQGQLLSEMTKGTLELKVERKQSSTVFNYDVSISLPAMQYKQRILRLMHDIKLYPANLYDEQGTNEFRCKNQEDFEENLAAILSSNETKVIISSLMAQARLNGKEVLV